MGWEGISSKSCSDQNILSSVGLLDKTSKGGPSRIVFPQQCWGHYQPAAPGDGSFLIVSRLRSD